MKILIVAHGVTDQSLLGGPGRVAALHARELARLGHDVKVVTTDMISKGNRARSTSANLVGPGVEVSISRSRALTFWPNTMGPIMSLPASRRIRELRDWADVIHCHEWATTLTRAAMRGLVKNGKRLVIQPHGSIQPRRGWRSMLHHAFNSSLRADDVDVFLAGSSREEEEIRSVLQFTGDVRIVVNPMPLSRLTRTDPSVTRWRERWRWPEASTVILYAHRIVPNKGLDLALEALAALPEAYVLTVVGDDSEFAEHCRKLAVERGVDARVRFVGAVTAAEIDEVILAADLFILPARRDTFPLMVLHALACGVPTVVTSTCQSVEALREAVMIAEPTAPSLAAALRGAVTGADRHGSTGRRLVKSMFSPNQVAQQLVNIYQSSQVHEARVEERGAHA